MPDNHADLARIAFDKSNMPPPPRQLSDGLRFIVNLLQILPTSERFGYVKSSPGAANTVSHEGNYIRISRVMYPDGQIIKVLSDAPNGNPQWVREDVRPELYIAYTGIPIPIPELPPLPLPINYGPRIEAIELNVDSILEMIGTLNRQLRDLTNDMNLNLIVKGKTSRNYYHDHDIELTVRKK